jgi:4-phytase/acid phosphatase
MARAEVATGWWPIWAAAMMLGIAALAPACASVPSPERVTVERVVMVMRHGVRPPTKEPALPPEVAPDPWPRWPVPPGWLTPHGTEAIRLLGQGDRLVFANEGVLPAASCPDAGAVALWSDSDERTIATGDAYLHGLAPGCAITNHHLAQGVHDPLFHDPETTKIDPDIANGVVTTALGPEGVAGAERLQRRALRTIDHILCGTWTGKCGTSAQPSELVPAVAGKPPKMSGALELGSSAAQSILLEYADGKPMSEVGWGRASADDIERVGALHSAGFAILARPPVLAAANAAGIVKTVLGALRNETARMTVIVGHDTNVANLAGLLDLHWHVPGFAADDPTPGGALIFELLRDSARHQFVRVIYRSQTLEQMRHLGLEKAEREPLGLAKCEMRGICSLDAFARLISQ